MVYSKTEVEKVIKTLPISYYAFKEMSVRLTDEDRTYINLATYAINISYHMIRKAMADAERKSIATLKACVVLFCTTKCLMLFLLLWT